MANNKKITPMMEQYWDFKKDIPKDTLLLFRLGDFYEMFYDDAVEGSKILGITLTKRQNYPMAGIPYHCIDQYLKKLLDSGKKVAICEQHEKKPDEKIVKRYISRIISAGTFLEDSQLEAKERNFMYAIDIDLKTRRLFASWIDISTGEFQTSVFDDPADFLPILSANRPKEILLPEEASNLWKSDPNLIMWHINFRHILDLCPVTLIYDYIFDLEYGYNQVIKALDKLNLDGFGISCSYPSIGTAGALVFYTSESLRHLPALHTIKKFDSGKHMLIDASTQRNLELFKTSYGSRTGSLLDIIDNTNSPAGARLLESYLAHPSMNIREIRHRQECSFELYSNPSLLNKLCDKISNIRDITRILSRLKNGLKNPKELKSILQTIQSIEPIKAILEEINLPKSKELSSKIESFKDLETLLENALNEELPSKLQDGSIIREGFDAELDEIITISKNSNNMLLEFEKEQQELTGIKNLRIKHTGPFGFSIEVTKSNLALVPQYYIRKQTLVNAERFTTEVLTKMEAEILTAQERALAREVEIFESILSKILEKSNALIETANILAEIDIYASFAKSAIEWDYTMPVFDEACDSIEIKQGRHPVIEQMLKKDSIGLVQTNNFVPNDTYLSSCDEQIALITGPNMAGKSTYIRQVALIAIMAQIGSFVPAKSCRLSITDRLFSRVGASDELSRGNSTFMVEMNETANILNNATDNSLIILDEIGRGTSTYDGLSIAWSIVEYLHKSDLRGTKTLFATHYHELTKLEGMLSRLVNYKVCVKEYNDDIIFTRTIEKGQADRSYGIQVAKLAGLAPEIISRAKEVLAELEKEGNIVVCKLDSKLAQSPKLKGMKKKILLDGEDGVSQLSFF
ncbi:MAG: DNA mismatch repair protein MutS [Opitutales bacterium]